jgi:hypothetical protein
MGLARLLRMGLFDDLTLARQGLDAMRALRLPLGTAHLTDCEDCTTAGTASRIGARSRTRLEPRSMNEYHATETRP